MSIDAFIKQNVRVGSMVSLGQVDRVREDGIVMVRPATGDEDPVACLVLTDVPGLGERLKSGVRVLYAAPADGESGCVIGTVGRLPIGDAEVPASALSADERVLRHHYREVEIIADSKLVLRCGEGSLTIGPDGTVIVKGARVLSRAKGVNKIKGGAVQIN